MYVPPAVRTFNAGRGWTGEFHVNGNATASADGASVVSSTATAPIDARDRTAGRQNRGETERMRSPPGRAA